MSVIRQPVVTPPDVTRSVSGDLPGEMTVSTALRRIAVAVVYSRTPLPMKRADQMTVAHLIAFLSARGHAVDLYALDEGEPLSPVQRDWLDRHCRTVSLVRHGGWARLAGVAAGLMRGLPLQVGWFDSRRQRRAVERGMARVDIAYCYYIRSAEALRHAPRDKPAFLAMQLSQSLNTRRMVAHYRDLKEWLVSLIESRLVRDYEARVWRNFTRTVLIGERDAAEIRAICRAKGLPEIDNVIFGAHGTDIARFAPRRDIRPVPRSLIFNGVLRTYTNVHAITWFVEEVWPLLRARVPDATLTVVGRDPRPEVRELAHHEGITVTGEVEDPAAYIAAAAVCIDPVQVGAGMQNKLIEFMAMEKPVVATTVANEGIGAVPGAHLVLADAPNAMASEIAALFEDPGRAAAMARAARRFVEENWSWEAHFLKLEAEMLRAVDEAAER